MDPSEVSVLIRVAEKLNRMQIILLRIALADLGVKEPPEPLSDAPSIADALHSLGLAEELLSGLPLRQNGNGEERKE